ncbi:MAG: SpoIIE family protein phosphatase, partial [Planctomycetales bacterium]|nr:SpoIIE family protein phosphatase [Planctomycetales bacterium]
VEVDVTRTTVREGDLFLLCTDGLTDLVSDSDIADVLGRHGNDLEACAKALVKLANERGGDDNVSVALAQV